MVKPCIVFDVSGHGYGHLAQSAPVIARLLEDAPAPRVVIRTSVPTAIVRDRLGTAIETVPHTTDVGMVMGSPNAVRAGPSHRAHVAFHAGWEASVERDARALDALGATLLVSNVGYRGLAAAAVAGVPSIAFSSLDWARIYAHYCADMPGARRVLSQMRAAYASARPFLSLEPGLGRHGFRAIERVGPIGARGERDREALAGLAGAAPGDALVLVTPGGIASAIDLRRWPRAPGVRWIAPAALAANAPGTASLESIGWRHVDVLASIDAVVTKPGYGTFVDSACNARPLLYTRRPDWPEEPRLGRWLAQRVPSATIAWSDLVRGRFRRRLETLLGAPPTEPIEPTGIDEVAGTIKARLRAARAR